ncbi:hypothetical protein ACIQ9P_33125 [Kitasatospora sp. NPDC094019]|uniref:hypothetical protein n=1 Tax=Kitasatospora sp. NPDC094019 TaxID=3364091 RepID=UPI003820C078
MTSYRIDPDRHTGLTWMTEAIVPLHVLRKIAGHGSLTTTQRYLHPDRRSIELAGAALNAHLSGPREAPGPEVVPQDSPGRHLRLARRPRFGNGKSPAGPDFRPVSGAPTSLSGRQDLNLRPLDPQSRGSTIVGSRGLQVSVF